jgi:hypothetical protein
MCMTKTIEKEILGFFQQSTEQLTRDQLSAVSTYETDLGI